MKKAKLFKNGQSQAVRLPREFRFEGGEVYVKRMGDAVVLLPVDSVWNPLLSSLDKFPSDFMEQREQPGPVEQREDLL